MTRILALLAALALVGCGGGLNNAKLNGCAMCRLGWNGQLAAECETLTPQACADYFKDGAAK